jgi:UDP:flavonoid glycosyltransferase YjiC (YdhE family)
MEKGKKIFVLSIPAHGHINPLSCVISHMLKKDPDLNITFYSTAEFKNLVDKTGANYKQYEFYLPGNPEAKSKRFVLYGLVKRLTSLADENLPGILRDIEKEKPDMIIYDSFSLLAKYALKICERKYKTGQTNVPPPLGVDFSTSFAQHKDVNEIRALMMQSIKLNIWFIITMFLILFLQLKAFWKYEFENFNLMDWIFQADEKLVINSVFPEFQPHREKFNDSFKFVGCCISDSVRKIDINNAKLDEFLSVHKPVNPLVSIEEKSKNNKELIYVSLGTVFNQNTTVFEKIIDAFKQIDKEDKQKVNMIVSMGKDIHEIFEKRIKNGQLNIPDNLVLLPFAPQIEILKRASLFITHAGMNSAHEAMKYAVPVICIPLNADQPAVSSRLCHELQFGRKFDPESFSSQELKNAVYDVLSNKSYLQRIIEFSKLCEKYNGTETASQHIIEHLNNNNASSTKKLN